MAEIYEFTDALWKAFCGPGWSQYTGPRPEQQLALRAVACVALERAIEAASAEVPDTQVYDTPHGTRQVVRVTRKPTLEEALAAIRALLPPNPTAPPPAPR